MFSAATFFSSLWNNSCQFQPRTPHPPHPTLLYRPTGPPTGRGGAATQVGGQWERALALLREMPARGLTPCVISYNTAISACAKSGKGEEVRENNKEESRGPAAALCSFVESCTAVSVAIDSYIFYIMYVHASIILYVQTTLVSCVL